MPQGGLRNADEAVGSSLEYYVLDVFSATRLEGNALAVVLHSGSLTTERMQAIARETNLSETTFVERRDAETERREGVLVRIFTTDEELPFAGHPTLGTASLLKAIAPECVADDTVKLALKVGAVPVRFEPQSSDAAWPVKGTMTQRDPEFGAELDTHKVAALTGLDVEDFDPTLPVQIVSTGTAFAIVALRSAEALSRLRLRQDEATAYLRTRGARWFYVLGPTGSAPSTDAPAWRARMQFNGGEDPATGSAAGCAISYLVEHGAVPSGETIHVRQGVEILRPSDLYLSAERIFAGGNASSSGLQSKVTNVRVGGSTILVAMGRIFLP
ncbi:MAG TPA: PhzF family phenazine biosynthesis protein [Acidobacteriaceae bacterium]|nr:PhzF family phenazine biosynthesis protein [Acidobacteriaceae bacterium]